MNWEERMTVRVQEFHDLIRDKQELKKRVAELESELAELKGKQEGRS
jgi:predicted  nucleic acid-binding Zn-ribbon protein